MRETNIFVLCIFLVFSCIHKEKDSKHKKKSVTNVSKSDIRNNEILIYQKGERLCDLSDVAEKVEYIAIDDKVPVDVSKVIDIALSQDYIFLLMMYEIFQYDKNGQFIRKIGNRGQGPREFIQLASPIQLDENNRLIYVLDEKGNKIQIYDFEGNHNHSIKVKSSDTSFTLLSSKRLLIQKGFSYRFIKDEEPFMRIIETMEGTIIKEFYSSLYPLNKSDMEVYGTQTTCFCWKFNSSPYFLEFGADTIYQIRDDICLPSSVLGGNLKPKFNNLFDKKIGENLRIFDFIFHHRQSVFETNKFFIFRVRNDKESFFSIYDKELKKVFSTDCLGKKHIEFGRIRKDYFIDNIILGVEFDPIYQSNDRYMSLISSDFFLENKHKIFSFLKENSLEENKRIKEMISNISEDTNPILCIVKFK